MISRFSGEISSFLVERRIIQKSEWEIYEYSFELLLSFIINCVVVGVFLIFSHGHMEVCLYVAGFITMRIFSGGYHADTHLKCMLLLMVVLMTFRIFMNILPEYSFSTVATIGYIISAGLNGLLAPVEDANKPLEKGERISFKTKNTVVLVALGLLTVVLLQNGYSRQACSLMFGMATISFSLVFAKFKYRRKSNGRN